MGEKLPPITRRVDTSTPKPKLILFYKNGDRNFRGHHVTVTQRRFRNFESLLSELTRITNLPQGARFLFDSTTGTRINSLDQLQDGHSYVASSNSKFKRILYNHAPDGTARTKTTEKKHIPSHTNTKTTKVGTTTITTTTTTTTAATIEKFPTNVKPRLITVVRNSVGGPTRCASVLLNKRTAQTYNQVLNNITETVGGGAVWKLYTMEGRLVKGLNELFNGSGVFIAVGSERFRSSDAPLVLEQLARYGAARKGSTSAVSTPSSVKQQQWRNGVRKGKYRSGSLDIEHSSQYSSLRKLPKIKRTSSMHSCNTPVLGTKTPVRGGDTPVLPGIRTSQKTNKATDNRTNGHAGSKHTPTHVTNGSSTHHNHDDDTNGLMNKKTPLPSIGNTSASSSRSSASKSRKGLESHSSSNGSSTDDDEEDRRDDLNDDLSSVTTDSKDSEVTTFTGVEKNANGELVHVKFTEEALDEPPDDDTTTDEETQREETNDTLTEEQSTGATEKDGKTKTKASSPQPSAPPSSDPLQTNGTKQKSKPSLPVQLKPSAPVEPPVKEHHITNHQLSSSSEINTYYKVGDKLGDGNFAVVKTCYDVHTNTKYALKIINASKLTGKEDMLNNEILIQRTSRHPNLVQLLHDFHSPTEIFLVMELITGGDLFDLIAENIRFEEEESAMFTRDICSGLDYLHRRNIVHRDIKPENLMVSTSAKDGTVSLKIADFGLAQKLDGGLVYTVCGTPTYVSPEILKGEGYGVEVDVWAVGVIMYIMLCGFPPFRSPDRRQSELFDRIESGEFEFLEPYWDDVSDLAEDVISRVLVVDVRHRYSCMDILAHDWLTQFGLTRTNTMDPPSPCTPSPAPPSPSKFKSAVNGVMAVERMKKLVGERLERGENFIEQVPTRGTSATTTTDTVT